MSRRYELPPFITFEGGEGCGKSHQSRCLYRKLELLGIPAIRIREPGGTPLGEKVRYLLKRSRQISMSSLTELLLFNASRSQLVSDVILPALKSGKVVICDRFSDSSVAYQSFSRGLGLDIVNTVNRIASRTLSPDLTILLDAPPEVGLSRKQPNANDRFEEEDLEFHRRVRDGFLTLAKQDPQRWVVIDATRAKTQTRNAIWDKVADFLEYRNRN